MIGKSDLGCPRFAAHLNDSPEFIYFTRVWWDGAGEDAIIWYADQSGGARRLVYATGEQIDPASAPNVLADEPVKYDSFSKLRDRFIDTFDSKLSDQILLLRYTHYDDYLGIKTKDEQVRQIKVPGGQHADERFQMAREALFETAPELSNFYERQE